MSSTLYVDKVAEKTSAAGVYIPGHVIQVVHTDYTTYTSTTSTSSVLMFAAGAITPKSTTSKILVEIKLNGMYIAGGTAKYFHINIYRGATSIKLCTTTAGYLSAGDEPSYGVYTNSYSVLDSPSTTSAITYGVYWKVSSGTGTINNYNAGNTSSNSSITVMEIAQ